MLILVLAMWVAAVVHRYLQVYAPSNAIVARVRGERPRVRVAGELLVLAAAVAFGAVNLANWATNGGPGWLNLIVLIAIWDCFKFAVMALAVFLRCVVATLRKTPHGPPRLRICLRPSRTHQPRVAASVTAAGSGLRPG